MSLGKRLLGCPSNNIVNFRVLDKNLQNLIVHRPTARYVPRATPAVANELFTQARYHERRLTELPAINNVYATHVLEYNDTVVNLYNLLGTKDCSEIPTSSHQMHGSPSDNAPEDGHFAQNLDLLSSQDLVKTLVLFQEGGILTEQRLAPLKKALLKRSNELMPAELVGVIHSLASHISQTHAAKAKAEPTINPKDPIPIEDIDVAFIKHMVDQLKTDIRGLEPASVARLMWAMSQLDLVNDDLYHKVAHRVAYFPTKFTIKEVSHIVVAYAKANFHSRRLFGVLTQPVLEHRNSANIHDICSIIWAYIHIGEGNLINRTGYIEGRSYLTRSNFFRTLSVYVAVYSAHMRPHELLTCFHAYTHIDGLCNFAPHARLFDYLFSAAEKSLSEFDKDQLVAFLDTKVQLGKTHLPSIEAARLSVLSKWDQFEADPVALNKVVKSLSAFNIIHPFAEKTMFLPAHLTPVDS